MVHYALIEIFTAQVGIAIGSDDLEYAVVDGKQTHIKSATTQIEYQYVLFSIFFI